MTVCLRLWTLRWGWSPALVAGEIRAPGPFSRSLTGPVWPVRMSLWVVLEGDAGHLGVVVQRKCPPKCSGKMSVGMVLSY